MNSPKDNKHQEEQDKLLDIVQGGVSHLAYVKYCFLQFPSSVRREQLDALLTVALELSLEIAYPGGPVPCRECLKYAVMCSECLKNAGIGGLNENN